MEIPKFERPTTVKSLDSTISTPPPEVKAFQLASVDVSIDWIQILILVFLINTRAYDISLFLIDHNSSRLFSTACWTHWPLRSWVPPRYRSCVPRRSEKIRRHRRWVEGWMRWVLSKRTYTWGERPSEGAEGDESGDEWEADAHPKRVVHSYMITDNIVIVKYTAGWANTTTSSPTRISSISSQGCLAVSSPSPSAIRSISPEADSMCSYHSINTQSAPSHQNNQGKYTHFSHALRTIWK